MVIVFARQAQCFVISLLFIYFFYSERLFPNTGEFGVKKYFTDHQTANTLQVVVVMKGNLSGLLFF